MICSYKAQEGTGVVSRALVDSSPFRGHGGGFNQKLELI